MKGSIDGQGIGAGDHGSQERKGPGKGGKGVKDGKITREDVETLSEHQGGLFRHGAIWKVVLPGCGTAKEFLDADYDDQSQSRLAAISELKQSGYTFPPATLFLTIKKVFFDQILAKQKLEEYREIGYWTPRLLGTKVYDAVKIVNGRRLASPYAILRLGNITIKPLPACVQDVDESLKFGEKVIALELKEVLEARR